MSFMRGFKRSVQKCQGTFESARERNIREARENITANAAMISEWWQS
jgi:hypothetical protein